MYRHSGCNVFFGCCSFVLLVYIGFLSADIGFSAIGRFVFHLLFIPPGGSPQRMLFTVRRTVAQQRGAINIEEDCPMIKEWGFCERPS
jgi:hypothetical protein